MIRIQFSTEFLAPFKRFSPNWKKTLMKWKILNFSDPNRGADPNTYPINDKFCIVHTYMYIRLFLQMLSEKNEIKNKRF